MQNNISIPILFACSNSRELRKYRVILYIYPCGCAARRDFICPQNIVYLNGELSMKRTAMKKRENLKGANALQTPLSQLEQSLLCLDNCIADIADHYWCDYEMMYFAGYETYIPKKSKGFADGCDIQMREPFEALEKLHGLYIMRQEFYSWRVAIRSMQAQLKTKHWILLMVDYRKCPWSGRLHEYRATQKHYIVAKGLYDGGIICSDTYFGRELLKLPYSYFRKCVIEIYFTKFRKKRRPFTSEAMDLLEKLFKDFANNGFLDLLKLIAEDFRQCKDPFEGITSDEGFWVSPIPCLTVKITQSIQNTMAVIGYIAWLCDSCPMAYLESKVWNLSIKWQQIQKMMIKLYFSRQENIELKNYIATRMFTEIRALEKITALNPAQYSESVYYCSIRVKQKPKKYFLPIERFANNKAFVRRNELEKGRIDADFTSTGICLVVDGGEKTGFDNMACSGQKLEVYPWRYHDIVFFGAAEFGDSFDIVRMVAENGREFEMELRLTDFECEPSFNERVVWEGCGIQKLSDGYKWLPGNLHIFEQRMQMPGEKITEIIFPVNPCIHLFAVVLEIT